MLKKTLIALFLLLSALPALAAPVTCDCFYCATHLDELCKPAGGGPTRLCSEFLKRCAPSLASAMPEAPSQEQFLARLSSETAAADIADIAPSCR